MTAQLDRLYTAFMEGVYGDLEKAAPQDFVKYRSGIDAKEQLAIYRSSVRETLIQALQDIYPAVHSGLGERNFRLLARDYVDQFPSQSSSLDDYGAFLSDFMLQHPALQEQRHMADVARVDWCWHRAFHAADTPLPDPHRIKQALLNTETTLLQRASGAALVLSTHPCFDLWRLGRGFISEHAVKASATAQACLVWRHGYDVCVAIANETDQLLYKSIENPVAYGTKLDELLSKCDAQQVVEGFVRALSQGWLIVCEETDD